jgi:hypothetical protein
MKDMDMALINRLAVMLIMFSLVGFVLYHIVTMDEKNAEGQTARIEEILNDAVVQCYALEGAYPPDVEYLQKYGVILNKSKYMYRYEFFFENIAPNITVVTR